MARKVTCAMLVLYCAYAALVTAAAVSNGHYLPIRAGALALFALTLVALLVIRTSTASMLSRLSVILYSAPFVGTVGYFFDPDFRFWNTPLAIEVLGNTTTVRIMMSIGVIGLLGLVIGLGAADLFTSRKEHRASAPRPVLPLWLYAVLCSACVFLSWLSAPEKTIFVVAYATAGNHAVSEQLNFNAAFLVSYILAAMLYIDAEADPRHGDRRPLKIVMLAGASLYIIVVLQLLRGDRECISLIIAIFGLYVTRVGGSFSRRVREFLEQKKLRKIIVVAIPVFLLFTGMGYIRGRVNAQARQSLSILSGLRNSLLQDNTWTGVLLTNLGQAHEYRSGAADVLHGETYVDYLQSLPPGFITRPLGIERPLESDRGPGFWYFPLAGGGIHLAVVPFKNFGPFGLVVVLAMIGFAIGYVDAINSGTRSSWIRLLYASIAAALPHWFWYGDMNVIRAVMIAALIWMFYEVLLMIFERPATAARRTRRVEAMLAHRH